MFYLSIYLYTYLFVYSCLLLSMFMYIFIAPRGRAARSGAPAGGKILARKMGRGHPLEPLLSHLREDISNSENNDI